MKKRFYFRRDVSENNTKNPHYSNSTIVESSYFYKHLINRFLGGCILVSAGILLAESGGSWDITNHLLNKPETFFSPPHVILYSGIALSLVGASIMFLYWRSYSIYISPTHRETKLTHAWPKNF